MFSGKCFMVLVLVCYNVGIAPKWACVHRKNTSTAKHPSKHPGLFPRRLLSRFSQSLLLHNKVTGISGPQARRPALPRSPACICH